MPLIDLLDETFIAAEPSIVVSRFADENLWRSWWPRLRMSVFMDRGAAGIRWSVTGELTGSSEVWLEPFKDGVIVHYFLRVDPVRPGTTAEARTDFSARQAARLRRRYVLDWKRRVNGLKDELEGGRPPGLPRPAAI